jgi:hypothetical protein
MIVYVLFVHKKSVSKRKVCIIFIKNLKFKKTQKKTFFVVFFRWVFWGFFGWFFIANPATWRMVSAALLAAAPLTRVSSGCWPVAMCCLLQ